MPSAAPISGVEGVWRADVNFVGTVNDLFKAKRRGPLSGVEGAVLVMLAGPYMCRAAGSLVMAQQSEGWS